MNPSKKAKELYYKFFQQLSNTLDVTYEYSSIEGEEECAKQCAIIAVDEIIIALECINDSRLYNEQYQYWQQVKEEILKNK